MAKAENYTPEMTQEIVAAYEAAPTSQSEADQNARAAVVKELAAKFGKSDKSIIAKLVREEKYIAKEAKSKVTKGKPQTKAALAEKLAHVSGLELNTESVAKMGKADLIALISAFELTEAEAAEVDAEPEATDENDSQEDES